MGGYDGLVESLKLIYSVVMPDRSGDDILVGLRHNKVLLYGVVDAQGNTILPVAYERIYKTRKNTHYNQRITAIERILFNTGISIDLVTQETIPLPTKQALNTRCSIRYLSGAPYLYHRETGSDYIELHNLQGNKLISLEGTILKDGVQDDIILADQVNNILTIYDHKLNIKYSLLVNVKDVSIVNGNYMVSTEQDGVLLLPFNGGAIQISKEANNIAPLYDGTILILRYNRILKVLNNQFEEIENHYKLIKSVDAEDKHISGKVHLILANEHTNEKIKLVDMNTSIKRTKPSWIDQRRLNEIRKERQV